MSKFECNKKKIGSSLDYIGRKIQILFDDFGLVYKYTVVVG